MYANRPKIFFNFLINLATGWSAGMLFTCTVLPCLMVIGTLPVLLVAVSCAATYSSFMLIRELTKKTQYDLLEDIQWLEQKAKTLEFLQSNPYEIVQSIKKIDLLALQRKRTMKSLMLAGSLLVAVWTLASATITALAFMHFVPVGLFVAGTLSGPIGIAFLLLAIIAATALFALKLKQQYSQKGQLHAANLNQVCEKLKNLETCCDQWLQKNAIEDKKSIFTKIKDLMSDPVIKTTMTILSTFSLFYSIGKLLALLPLITFIWAPPVWIITCVAITFGALAGLVCYAREREILAAVPSWHLMKNKAHQVAEKLAFIEDKMTPKIEKKSLPDQLQSIFATAWFEYQYNVLRQFDLRIKLRRLQQRANDSELSDHLANWLYSKISAVQSELAKIDRKIILICKLVHDLRQNAEELIGKKAKILIPNSQTFNQLFTFVNSATAQHSLEDLTITPVNSETHHYVRSPNIRQTLAEDDNITTEYCSISNR